MSEPANFGYRQADLWVQAVTATAVILGLALVIWELRESRSLAQAQIIQDRWIELSQNQLAIIGEGGAAALAHACLGSPLSPEQKVIMDAHFRVQMFRAHSAKRLLDETGIDNGWRRVMRLGIAVIVGYPGGEAWLKRYQAGDPAIAAAIHAEIPRITPTPCPAGADPEQRTAYRTEL